MAARKLLPYLLLAPLAPGCSTYGQFERVIATYEAGRIDEAADLIASEQYADERDSGRDGVIWLLETGKILQDAGRFQQSDAAFGQADRRVREFDRTADVRLGEELGSLLGNMQVLDYRGRGWEKILLETYRALNQLALGDLGEALVFCRRAYVRQQEAVQHHAEDIQRTEEAAREKKLDPDGVMAQGDVQAMLAELDTRVNPAYADYANPFTSFLTALLLWIDGDLANARVDMKKALAMEPENGYLRELLDELEAGAPPGGESGRVFVIFELGLAPARVETGIAIITPNGYSEIALPELRFRLASGSLAVGDPEAEGEHATALLADVNAIVATDFRNQLPGIVLRTVLSLTVKEVATYQGRQQDNTWGFVLGSVWKALTAQADLRTWRTVGAELQVAHLDRPASGELRIALLDEGGGRHLERVVEIPPAPVVLVLARSASLASLRIHVLPVANGNEPTP